MLGFLSTYAKDKKPINDNPTINVSVYCLNSNNSIKISEEERPAPTTYWVVITMNYKGVGKSYLGYGSSQGEALKNAIQAFNDDQD